MAHIPQVDRAALAARIQGFGNVNPPPLEEETGATLAKRAVSRLGDIVGEEVMLTVEDFREKGAVGAVKDAVADAGDILIDGVTGLIGWIRGDPPPAEDESEKAEDATKALAFGPNGAAYGISQASPTGGINAVWVMPEEADPAALAQLATQQGGGLVNDPRVPKNIQPYQPPPGRGAPPPMPQGFPGQIPGGPVIAPYQPAPSGPASRAPGPGGFPQSQQRWGPGGYAPGVAPGGFGVGGYTPGGFAPGGCGSSASTAGASGSGVKSLVDRISKGEVLAGSDSVKRLVSQCAATKTSGKQLGEIISERSRRLYLGLDGDADSDAALSRLLALLDAMKQHDSSELSKSALEEVKKSVSEEFLSLRSNAKHKDAAAPQLQRIGLISGGAASAEVDLLGGGGTTTAQEVDLLGGGGGTTATKEVDLLGTGGSSTTAPQADLLYTGAVSSTSGVQATLDSLLLPAPVSSSAGAGLLGLDLGATSFPAAAANGTAPPAAASGVRTLGAGASLQVKKDEDIFGFVGAEMSKAGSKS